MIKKLRKHKKGSHVGIIVSFTLFITAIIFLYSIVGSPIKLNKEKENSISDLKNNFFSFTQEEVVIARLYGDGTCVEFGNPISVDSSFNVFAVNSNGGEIGSSLGASVTSVSSFSGLGKVFYTKTSLDKTLSESGSCSIVTPSSVDQMDMILESKIIEVVNDSVENESKVRDDLRISNTDEFSLVFFYPNSTSIGERKREDLKGNIFAKTYAVRYLSNKGVEEVGEIEFRVW